jgi:hypothetical protein
MSLLGSHVVFRPGEDHHNTTKTKHPVTGKEIEHQGSVYHPELREFAGLVTRGYEDGTCDLIVFPPNRQPVHVERVPDEPVISTRAIKETVEVDGKPVEKETEIEVTGPSFALVEKTPTAREPEPGRFDRNRR